MAKTNEKTFNKLKIINCAVLISLAVLLLAFTFCDLAISKAIYNESSTFGYLFKIIGEIPAYLIIPLFFTSLIFMLKNKRLKIVFAVILPLSNYFWLGRFFDFFEMSTAVYIILMLLLMLGFSAVLFLIFNKLSYETRKKLFRIFLTGAIFALLCLISVQLIKIIWGRVRFRNLENNFTHWFVVNGINGNKSFPSGHTSAACEMFVVFLFFKEFKMKKWAKVSLSAFAVLFVLATAVSRIILGAHYATDVTFAILISFALFLGSIKLVNKFD